MRKFHPREGDPPDDALAEAQQERAALFFLQQQLLFTFAHETHDVAKQTRETLTGEPGAWVEPFLI